MPFKKAKPKPVRRGQGRKSNPQQAKGTTAPLWDLYRDGVTQGSIGLFLQCREQFRLKMLDGLSHKTPSEAIEFGSAFHAMLADIHGKGWSINKAAQAYLVHWKKNKYLLPVDIEKITFIVSTVSSILREYLIQWEKDDAKKKTRWVAREEVFRVPVKVHVPANSVLMSRVIEIILTGRWDGIFADTKKTNRLFETKTKSQIDEDGIMDALPFDLQTMLYCYTAQEHFGKRVSGTIYDVIRRPALRQGATETLTGFCERIDRDVKARPAHYFKRYRVTLDSKAIERFVEHQLKPILRDMVNWYEDMLQHLASPWESPSHYMNSNNLFTRFGKCDVFAVITRGATHGLYRRSVPYPELLD